MKMVSTQHLKSLIVLIVIFLLNVSTVYSIYEEEIGVKDWRLLNIGEFERFIELPASENTVIVQSRILNNIDSKYPFYSHILSSLDLNTGDIKWRQILPSQEHSFESLLYDDSLYILTISGGNNIRLWNKKTGSLKWYQKVQSVNDKCEGTITKDQVFLVCGGRDIIEVNKETGQITNQYLALEEITDKPLNIIGNSNQLYQINSDKVEFYQHTKGKKSLDKLKSIEKSLNEELDNWITGTLALNINDIIVTGRTTVHLYRVKQQKHQSFEISQFYEGGSGESVASLSYNGANQFQIQLTQSRVVLLLELSGETIKLVQKVNTKEEDTVPLKVVENGLVTRLIQLSGKNRLLVVSQDWSIKLISEGKVQWSREESLSAILNQEIIDYPQVSDISKLSELEYEFNETTGFFTHFARRLSTQFSSLLHPNRDNTPSTSSSNSISKMIIATTLSGKVFGISNDKGRVIWSFFISNFNNDNLKKLPLESSRMKIFITRKVIHYPPEAVLVYETLRAAGGQKQSRVLMHFNPLDGKKTGDDRIFNSEILHVALLPIQEDHNSHRNLLQIVLNYPVDQPDQPPIVYIHPWNEMTRKQSSVLKDISFYLIKGTQVQGYKIDNMADGKHGGFRPLPTWNLQLPQNQEIIAIGKSNPNEVVQAPALILGNRNLLPKYINRNLISLALYEKSTSQLVIHLLDSVSGEIIKSFVNVYSSSYVSIVHTENSVVYSHFDNYLHKQMISSIDLFEQTVKWNDYHYTPYLSQQEQLLIKHKSFVFPELISTLSLAITPKGITAKTILIGLKSGQILPVDKKFINSRRPYPEEVTPNDAEEGLMPYSPKLNFPPWFYVTYNISIPNLKSITSQGTDLESTSLVFSSGLDLFCTSITPSQPYDILSDDFNHLALILTSIVLLILAMVTKNLKSKYTIDKKWK
ncbi:hypothetical protein DLAC_10160 [Tieghemostelium lacteum]|uniref:ER membrane protein complex subunit 1 n=1 Tax=Tieghemostelium lacteum TaxID=361077 RepID=A0A151Z6B3_TIELA|nr:hypothetical protein DLAC_10160 [Tieghemostelium lacteum]|eukprot:KYQ89485.1 hypothetical protein DLAC_10160 [Tieghemostelium lacteum]